MSLPWQDIAWHDFEVDPRAWLRGKRIALLLDAGWGLAPAPEIVAAVQAAARRFEAAGATVEPLAPFATREMADGIDRFWRVRSWLDLQALPPERRELVLPFIRAWAGAGAQCSAAQLFHGYSQMAALRDATVAACQPFDAVLSPVAPVSAFPADWAMPVNDPAHAMEHIAFTLPYNMSEQPAISVPCTMDAAGRPIGLQIACRRHEDLATLRFARAWELLRDPLPPWPEPPV
jgi:Asp-tRNA(Asn)/Glu-tRNA(Gln) amidotransferase A subunit family amidase